MHFRTLLATAFPLLTLTAHALPLARRVNAVDNAGLPAAEKGAEGLGAALGNGGSSSAASQSSGSSSKGSGKNNVGTGGNSTQSTGQGKGQAASQQGKGNGQAATGTSSAAKAAKTRACDQGDQSLQQGLNALITVHIGLQAAAKTLGQTVSAKQINQKDFTTNKQRLQQFVTTAKLGLNMANAIADDDSFAQTQLKSLANSLSTQEKIVSGLKGQASEVNTLKNLQESFKKATGVVQNGVANSIIDCNLPLDAVSG